MWLFDALHGYHQIRVLSNSKEKLAFAGSDATKLTYNVIPHTFISFIHDMDSTWKDLAETMRVTTNNDINTQIIVGNILSWASLLANALSYIECQLRLCQQSQNLSFSLKKTHIFPVHMNFSGIDGSYNGNWLSTSKY